MQTQVFYLEARSPFHLGERGVGLEGTSVVARADTVFSALCVTYREWYGVEALENDFLEAFRESPPFLLSSAFPYVMLSDGPLRLFPRPLGAPPGLEEDNFATLKKIKKIAFVSEVIFNRWVTGDPLPVENIVLLHEGRVGVTQEESDALHEALDPDDENRIWLWRIDEVPRVTVDRVSSASAVYRAGRVRYALGGGVWVGFRWHGDGWSEIIEGLLHILGDAGLGGERSAGHGQFSLMGSGSMDLPDAAERFVTLSPYWPQPDEVTPALGEGSSYSLLLRRGWMGSPDGRALRRKAVMMLGEGSVLNMPSSPTPGGLAIVTPGILSTHEVYRYGYALPVGMWSGGEV